MTNEIINCIQRLRGIFHEAFITLDMELVLERKTNVFFRLDNISTELEFKCKLLEYCSRPAHKGLSERMQKYFRDRLNKYLDKDFSAEDWSRIYGPIGNGCNRKLCERFILSGYDFALLDDYYKKRKINEAAED